MAAWRSGHSRGEGYGGSARAEKVRPSRQSIRNGGLHLTLTGATVGGLGDWQSQRRFPRVRPMTGLSPEHVDVLIVGAGISGIGGAVHLQDRCPGTTFVILEGRPDIGGTWDLFRYPGVRSDSDMHTLGFRFKPWKHEKSIADGPVILDYLRETIAENDLARHIRSGHRVMTAEWSSGDASWTVTATRTDPDSGSEQPVTMTCGFLYMCSGYYSYREGYTPEFAGRERFGGRIVHPQEWPEDLDSVGKRVVVIGSGATAMTLVPAIGRRRGAHHDAPALPHLRGVTSVPGRLRQPPPPAPTRARVAYAIIAEEEHPSGRASCIARPGPNPEKIKNLLIGGVRAGLGPDYDVDTHFTPYLQPVGPTPLPHPGRRPVQGHQVGKGLCGHRHHRHVHRRRESSWQSGEDLEADIIVTATGLNLVTLGEMDFVVDGEPVDFARTWTYRGLAYSDVPNLVSSFGYVNASWTLKADLTSEYVCRLLKHMAKGGGPPAACRGYAPPTQTCRNARGSTTSRPAT